VPDKVYTFHSRSPGGTERLGEKIGKVLEPGMVIALIGELGAGKTTLTKGIARGLGVTGLVHSPTFTLIHEHAGRLPVYHFDLYRLESPRELEEVGYDGYLYGEGVCIIEWAEKALTLLPPDHLEITITGEDERRTFEMCAAGPNSAAVLDRIQS
jgi:tRNA threonylcarbamoyladenosine biosynthesis protein TsaE